VAVEQTGSDNTWFRVRRACVLVGYAMVAVLAYWGDSAMPVRC